MTDIQNLKEIMESLPGDADTVDEQQEEATGSRFEEMTDIQEDLREWHEQEDEQVDREPPELGKDIQHD
jgi:DNA-binding transcriptional regulator GbsR (MarR family)